jgi:hypothetical protein
VTVTTRAVDESLTGAAEGSAVVRHLRGLTRWVGAGRALTQTGRVKLADARELVAQLDTGDQIDPRIGDHVYRTTSSEELYGLNVILAWARAAGLVRVVKGRLVPVKKALPLLDRPLDLWDRAFEAFTSLGDAICPPGLAGSALQEEFEPAMTAVLSRLYGGRLPVGELYALAWEVSIDRYVIPAAPDPRAAMWRRVNDRDTELALRALESLGALHLSGAGEEAVAELTALGSRGARRLLGHAGPGEPVYELTVTLLDVSYPPVWRRLRVPAGIRLDRLHSVLQAAMGWEDHHLHAFFAGERRYGHPDADLELRDERGVPLADLVEGPGSRIEYVYDFGDEWQHEIVVERVLAGEAGDGGPACLAGQGACPPEDSGGAPGYQRLREALADPTDPEHEEFRTWLGLDETAEFAPERFDLDEVNRALLAIH